MRVIHKLDPVKVKASINARIKYYPGCKELEQSHYSTVRVVRLRPKKYVLVYGDVDDQTVTTGTGPFKTLRAASEWFYKEGR